jgi:hypothetical protein
MPANLRPSKRECALLLRSSESTLGSDSYGDVGAGGSIAKRPWFQGAFL